MKFGILLSLIISSCANIPNFGPVEFCSYVDYDIRCANYDLNNVEFISEWSDILSDEEAHEKLQYSIILSKEEFLLKFRPDLVKIRKYKKQRGKKPKKTKDSDPRFKDVTDIYQP